MERPICEPDVYTKGVVSMWPIWGVLIVDVVAVVVAAVYVTVRMW